MSNIAQLGQEFGQYVIQLTSELLTKVSQPTSLSEMERGIRQMLLKLGQFLMVAWLAMQESPYPEETRPCPHCGEEATYQFRREATLLTIVGQVTYRRAYYLCPQCHKGHYPLDDKLGLRPGEMSAELESLTAMTGVQLPFEQSSQLFEKLTLVLVSDHSVAKATQAMGSEVQAVEEEWVSQSHDEDWLQEQERLAERPQRLYGALDAAKVHTRGEEENPWRDMKVGVWFTTTTEPPQNPDDEWAIQATIRATTVISARPRSSVSCCGARDVNAMPNWLRNWFSWVMARSGYGTWFRSIILKRFKSWIGFTRLSISLLWPRPFSMSKTNVKPGSSKSGQTCGTATSMLFLTHLPSLPSTRRLEKRLRKP